MLTVTLFTFNQCLGIRGAHGISMGGSVRSAYGDSRDEMLYRQVGAQGPFSRPGFGMEQPVYTAFSRLGSMPSYYYQNGAGGVGNVRSAEKLTNRQISIFPLSSLSLSLSLFL